MARARNIKPGLYKNEDLAECSIWARYLFPGLWTLADREGRLEDRPKRIKAELLPFDGQPVEPLLAELAARGFLVRYQIDGASFIQISKFSVHQSPHYSEKKSVIKPPPLQENTVDDETQNPRTAPEYSESEAVIKRGSQPPDSLIPDSLVLIPDSPIVRLSDSPTAGKSGAHKRASPARKTPMPENFAISSRVKNWAIGKGFNNLDAHFEGFVGKAKAKGYSYVDWDEALMTAIRDDWSGLRKGNGRTSGNAEEIAKAKQKLFGQTEKDITHDSERV